MEYKDSWQNKSSYALVPWYQFTKCTYYVFPADCACLRVSFASIISNSMLYTIHWYNWYSTLLFNSYNDINLYIPQAPLKQHIWQAFAELCHAGQLTVLDPVRQTWPTATKSQDMPVLQGPMMNLLFWRCRTYWTYNLVHFRFNRYHTDNSKIWSEMIWYVYIYIDMCTTM